MKKKQEIKKGGLPERFTYRVMQATGSLTAIIIAFILIIVWGLAGLVFHFSENWLMVINTITSIVTFLMVFLIQKAHNKDSLAIQLKLNELVAAHESANNKLVSVEHMPEEELKMIQEDYLRIRDDEKQKVPQNDIPEKKIVPSKIKKDK
jgi:low affinity Fe/Cu permease